MIETIRKKRRTKTRGTKTKKNFSSKKFNLKRKTYHPFSDPFFPLLLHLGETEYSRANTSTMQTNSERNGKVSCLKKKNIENDQMIFFFSF